MVLLGDWTIGDGVPGGAADCNWTETKAQLEKVFGRPGGARSLALSGRRQKETATYRVSVSTRLFPFPAEGGQGSGGSRSIPPVGGATTGSASKGADRSGVQPVGGDVPSASGGSSNVWVCLFLVVCLVSAGACGWCVARFVTHVGLNVSGTEVTAPVPLFGGRSVLVQNGDVDTFSANVATVALRPRAGQQPLFTLQAKGAQVLLAPAGIAQALDSAGNPIVGTLALEHGAQSVYVQLPEVDGQLEVPLVVRNVWESNGQRLQLAILSGIVAILGLVAMIVA